MDLSLATLEEITEELAKRSQAFVLILQMEGEKADSESDAFKYFYAGGPAAAIGLTMMARIKILGTQYATPDDKQ